VNYSIQGLNQGKGLIGHATGGWGVSGTSIYQSGYPFTVVNTAPFAPLKDASGKFIGYAPGSGDYNADGDNFDYPDAQNYTQGTTRSAFLGGIFAPGQFTAPSTFGAGGNEKSNAFREPNFAETDVSFYKDNRIHESINFQLRFEFYNIFNRPNLANVDANPVDATFGKALSQQLPRWWQIGAKVTF
jgi:hypothetical protein